MIGEQLHDNDNQDVREIQQWRTFIASLPAPALEGAA